MRAKDVWREQDYTSLIKHIYIYMPAVIMRSGFRRPVTENLCGKRSGSRTSRWDEQVAVFAYEADSSRGKHRA